MFDSITLFDWAPSFGVGRRGRKLLDRGEAATATITGIRVSHTGTDSDGVNCQDYVYALDVRTGTGVRRLACRQRLTPHRELVHLGSQVHVRVDRDRVIIDWEATLDDLGQDSHLGESAGFWKPLDPSKAPADGVVDFEQNGAQKLIRQGQPATATVLRINELRSELFGMALENVDVDVQVVANDGSTRQALVRKVIPPDYAHHLLRVGSVVPVGVDRGGERITIDWVAAASGEARIDPSPPVPTRKPGAPPAPSPQPGAGAAVASGLQGLLGKMMDAGGMPTEAPLDAEFPFETYVEVSARLTKYAIPPSQHDAYAEQFGVAPGAWGPGSRAWQSRMVRDWKLGAEYGEAYQAAYKRLG